jgi:hypothetical protein
VGSLKPESILFMVPNWAHSSRRYDPRLENWGDWGSRRVPAFHGLIERRASILAISETDIRRVARQFRVPNLPEAVVLQAWHEFRLKTKRVFFRCAQNEKAIGAYCAMQPNEFQHINARQAWANWRTIPRPTCRSSRSTCAAAPGSPHP